MSRPKQGVDGFLRDLARISEKYGLKVGGCGCFGSPHLRELKTGKIVAEKITFDPETGVYREGDPPD